MVEPLALNLALVAAVMLLLWLAALRLRDVSFIDAVWGGGMAMLAVASWLMAQPHSSTRAGLIAAMTVIWGARLAVHLFTRWRRSGEDPRYRKILGPSDTGSPWNRAALLRVFAPQAVLLYAVCLPAQLGILAPSGGGDRPGPLVVAGAALWLVGIVFETVGDAQLARFRADPAMRGRVLAAGLWRYTRHPNYFGDACVWWGIWLTSTDAGWPVALGGLIGPVFLTFTLTRWSGKPLLEQGLAKSRPGYSEYIKRTSGFIPWPPKRG